jgi:hypothetical protein
MRDELFDPTMMQQGESTTNNLWNSRRNDSPECGTEDLNAERLAAMRSPRLIARVLADRTPMASLTGAHLTSPPIGPP